MQRIVKRFLLHNQSESHGSKKGFIEFKQDLQLCRYEVLNGMKRKKNDSVIIQHLVHAGLNILGDEIFSKKKSKYSELNRQRFTKYKNITSEMFLQDNQFLTIGSKNENSSSGSENDELTSTKPKKLGIHAKSFYTVVRMAMIKQGLRIPKLTPSQKAATDLAPVLEDSNDPSEDVSTSQPLQTPLFANTSKRVSFSDINKIHQLRTNSLDE
jgi:hypothetical protein